MLKKYFKYIQIIILKLIFVTLFFPFDYFSGWFSSINQVKNNSSKYIYVVTYCVSGSRLHTVQDTEKYEHGPNFAANYTL